MTGPYAPAYWCLIACNIMTPQFLWFRKVRAKVGALFAIAMVVNVGMWLERFVIIALTSFAPRFPPSAWGMYFIRPDGDFFTFFGTIGLFLFLVFLFIRYLPLISIFEMRTLVAEEEEKKAAS